MLPEKFKCLVVTRDKDGNVTREITERPMDELPAGDALIRVAYSSLNYKDALAATGHPGVQRVSPLVPGVDLAGTVVESGVYELVADDLVLATGFDLGMKHSGGYAQFARVPFDWIVPMPEGLTPRESMIFGSAGLTAALCIEALQKHGVEPSSAHNDAGEVVVTGASGGVGSFAVAILAKLGYRVVAVTGKDSAHEYLKELGAETVIGREQVDDRSSQAMLSGHWAGAVDTVGGNTLGTILRSTQLGGCVAACGNAAGFDLPITVFPFILRGVTLAGIDAAWCPLPLRHETWHHLADEWKPDGLDRIARFIDFEELPSQFDEILAGQITGRVAVEIAGPSSEANE